MGFHKHGSFSFSIAVQKMSLIGGDSYVADVTALRRHASSGTAMSLDVPAIAEEYGETAQDAEGKAVASVRRWLDRHAASEPPFAFGRPDRNADAVNSA